MLISTFTGPALGRGQAAEIYETGSLGLFILWLMQWMRDFSFFIQNHLGSKNQEVTEMRMT